MRLTAKAGRAALTVVTRANCAPVPARNSARSAAGTTTGSTHAKFGDRRRQWVGQSGQV